MDDPGDHNNLLQDLLYVMRSVDESHAQELFALMRADASIPQLRAFIDRTLSEVQVTTGEEEKIHRLGQVRNRVDVESGIPPFRPKVMDVQYLCDIAPFRVPAHPWTTVTDDDALVSHLVSLYFTWDYPFYAFVDRKAFVHHMVRGNVDSDFCSPFLVNALLANACYYSQYSEAYDVPGDVATKGNNFLAEAERYLPRYQMEMNQGVRLASLQGALLLYERYAMSGQDDLGYTMLHLAIQMGESLQIINHDPLDLDKRQLSTEMVKSIQRTAWGLFQADTVVHTNFLRPSRVNSVAVDRIDRNESGPDDTWSPYPVEMQARPSYLSQYFDESCHLSSLARDISRHLYQSPVRSPRPRGRKDELYATLRQWERKLPPEFDADREPPPHILLLRMRYNSLLIGLARDGFGVQSLLSGSDEQRQTMDETSRAISLTAAQAISALARLHRRLYGMERAHQFATYAIVLGLFTMLDHPSFDILDPDFLSLTSGFSIIASRSQVGRYLFHIFRQSVRSRHQDERILQSDQVSDEVKELFGRHPRSQVPDRWSDYAQGLERYHSSFLGDSHDYAASDVRDMLEKYERLSLGREDSFEGRSGVILDGIPSQ